jgi:hypothetical protein
MLGFSADGAALIVRFTENGDGVWKPLNLKDNTWGAPLEKGAAFSRVIEERKSGRIIGGIRGVRSNHQYVFFDNELQAHWDAILRAFPDERIELESNSDDYSRVVLKVFGARDGYVYALYDWYAHRASILGRAYEDVAAPAEMRAISYPAADGLTIPGFLTLPRGAAEKDLPLIVMPHGGPAAADTQGFDWWAQALAAQGYAVLQPNFRGSTVDSSFLEAGFGEWGRKMQTDLSDGVRYLAHEGLIDPKRVCIVGASYGGYAGAAPASVRLVGRRGGRWGRRRSGVRIISARIHQFFLLHFSVGHEVGAALQIGVAYEGIRVEDLLQRFIQRQQVRALV